MGTLGHKVKFTRIIDHKSIIALQRLKRRYPSFNKFKKRMLSKNILVGLDDNFYYIKGMVSENDIEVFLNKTAG